MTTETKMTIEQAFEEAKRLYPGQKIDVGHRIQMDGQWKCLYVGEVFVFGSDFETVLNKAANTVKTPALIAAEKRSQAAALLAEADALEEKAKK
jgi:hypothetical protein